MSRTITRPKKATSLKVKRKGSKNKPKFEISFGFGKPPKRPKLKKGDTLIELGF